MMQTENDNRKKQPRTKLRARNTRKHTQKKYTKRKIPVIILAFRIYHLV